MEATQLWRDCRFADPQSARISEAYLDRAHPSWREDMAHQDGAAPARPSGKMSREQALEILGLVAGANERTFAVPTAN